MKTNKRYWELYWEELTNQAGIGFSHPKRTLMQTKRAVRKLEAYIDGLTDGFNKIAFAKKNARVRWEQEKLEKAMQI